MVCIANTTQVFQEPTLPGNSTKGATHVKHCRLPYAGGATSSFRKVPAPKQYTALAEKVEAQTRARMNRELVQERDEFMEVRVNPDMAPK